MHDFFDLSQKPVIRISANSKEIADWIDQNYETLYDIANPKHCSLTIYDGVDRRYENKKTKGIDLFDILITVGFNSNIDTEKKIEKAYKGIPQIEKLCCILNRTGNVDLHSINVDAQSPLVQAFVGYSYSKNRIPYICESSLSKILHKKFPGLVPILDTKFVTFYEKYKSIKDRTKISRRYVEQERKNYIESCYVKLFDAIRGDVTLNILTLMDVRRIIKDCTKCKLVLSPLRIWDLLVWGYKEIAESKPITVLPNRYIIPSFF